MYPYSTYTLSEKLWDDFPEKKSEVEYIARHRNDLTKEQKQGKLSNLRIITTNIFDLLSERYWGEDLFFDEKPDNGAYVCLLGRQNNERRFKYIKSCYIDLGGNYGKWKVVIPKSNGSGAIGEVLSTPLIGEPLIGEPLIGYTQSFLGIGAFNTEEEAQNCMKYIKSKFARALLGILKITQDNPPEKWKYVPLQDFTPASDIDWSQPVADIDRQLYAKYGLDDGEISFIESHVKEMD